MTGYGDAGNLVTTELNKQPHQKQAKAATKTNRKKNQQKFDQKQQIHIWYDDVVLVFLFFFLLIKAW